MGYTLKFSHPHFPEGTEFNVGNLGRVPNGGSLVIDEEAERLFLMSNGVTLADSFKGDDSVTLTGSSALDKSEVNEILAFFAPGEEEVSSEPEIDLATAGVTDNTTPVGLAQKDTTATTPAFLSSEGGESDAG